MISISSHLISLVAPGVTLESRPGLFVSSLYSFGGGGNAGRDTTMLEDEVGSAAGTPVTLTLIGQADRYDVAARRCATVVQICPDDHAMPTPVEARSIVDVLLPYAYQSIPGVDALLERLREIAGLPTDREVNADSGSEFAPDPVLTPDQEIARQYRTGERVREYLVITRHKALVQYLKEQGIIGADARVIEQATEDDVRGQHVIGILPIRLAALCDSYSECSLVLGPQDRGVTDLPIERVREIAQPLATYRVTAMAGM
jgi:hypothetical protein